MNIEQIKKQLKSDEYDFLRKDKNLGNNIIILTLGGSYAYGTNNENSDIDIRGCTLNSKMQILTNENFEQFIDKKTDTTIYAFNKLISLLINANPNIIEMLGNKPEYYFYIHPVGKELLDNKHLFLSKKVVYSFGGYANQQLRRLENKLNRNENVVKYDKLGKHMMHLIRLYIMCLDILEKEKIITYREKEHNLLMEIRNGKYLKNKQSILEFYEMINNYEKQLEYAKQNTSLPDRPNYIAINNFLASVNERIVKNEI